MADQWQFSINDGPWHNVDGQSHTYPTECVRAVKVNHRIKPVRTDDEILAAAREWLATQHSGGFPSGQELPLAKCHSAIVNILKGNF